MKDVYSTLEALDKIALNKTPVIREILRQDGFEAVKFYLWEATGWHEDFDPYVLGDDAPDEQKIMGWEMALKIKKIISKALYEEHKQQEEAIHRLTFEGPETFYRERKE